MYYIVQRLEWETKNKSDEIWLDFIAARDLRCVEHFMNRKGFKIIRKEGDFIQKKLKEIDDSFMMDCYTSDIMDAYTEYKRSESWD